LKDMLTTSCVGSCLESLIIVLYQSLWYRGNAGVCFVVLMQIAYSKCKMGKLCLSIHVFHLWNYWMNFCGCWMNLILIHISQHDLYFMWSLIFSKWFIVQKW
jgi:hypothetical protein